MSITWSNCLAQRTKGMSSSAIRELLKVTEKPNIISFGGGLPAPEVFPYQEIEKVCDRILSAEASLGASALQYGSTEGYIPLRKMLIETSPHQGVAIDLNNLIVTSGSQQALDLLGKIFINPGDHIVVESPTYMGALQAWNAYGANYTVIPSDDDGMIIDSLEAILRTKPKFIYVLPNFQNPTGITLSLERRIQLVKLADAYGIPIVEDDPYGQLRYEGESLPSLLTLDHELHPERSLSEYNGNIIYLSTFSKILSPGLRLAWVIAPPEVIRWLVCAKQGVDLHTSSLSQLIAYEVSLDGFLPKHIEHICKVYSERRDAMLNALQAYMPEGVCWTKPKGGLFLWVTLPEAYDSVKVLTLAIDNEVAFVPGQPFHPNGGGKNSMRLNFSYCEPKTIDIGISRLGKVFREAIC